MFTGVLSAIQCKFFLLIIIYLVFFSFPSMHCVSNKNQATLKKMVVIPPGALSIKLKIKSHLLKRFRFL